MDAEECRSEASFGIEDSNDTSSLGKYGDSNSTSVRTTEGCSPSGRKKRKRISPNSSPKVSDGFGDSEAGELLTKVPELAEVFSVVSKVGEGTFSNVYLAKMHEFPDELLALKHIIPTSAPVRIENELKCLQEIGGQDNVIGVQTTLRCRDHVVLALPYFPHQKFQDYLLEMSVCEIKDYMKNLFIALNRVHTFQVIHRDVKPSNFLYSRQCGRYSLVDFGLAMKVPGSSNSLLDSPKEPRDKRARTSACSHQSPKNSKAPRRRSSRLSPQMENRDLPGVLVKYGPADSKSVLKPSSINSANWQFAKGFKVPSRNVAIKSKKPAAGTKVLPGSKQDPAHKMHQVLCPLRHATKEICTICMARAHQNTPRAGTPGFRSPEVLLKYPNQTPAVDMWSAGIILLCILSGRYPFFRAYDDMTALAQIITVQGSKETAGAAFELGKDLVLGAESPAGNLKLLCQRLRRGETKSLSTSCSRRSTSDQHAPNIRSPKNSRREKSKSSGESTDDTTNCNTQSATNSLRHECCSFCQSKNISSGPKLRRSVSDSVEAKVCTCADTEGTDAVHLDGCKCPCTCATCCWAIPDAAYDLLRRCLDLDPQKRIPAAEALEHPFFDK